jgi:glycosyltransferase involved in cell wall biosynthesis
MFDNIPQLSPRKSIVGPRVTVVMPTYRRAHQIGESIRSLLEGTFPDFELLVRDDGNGTDGTSQAVTEAAGGDVRVRYHRNREPLRMPGNLNAGIQASRGELIAVCHDHDLYKQNFLARLVQVLDLHRSALFVHCAIDVIRQDGGYVCSHVGDWSEFMLGHSWLKVMLNSLHCPVCALTIVRREAHEKYGLYNLRYSFISDVEMWMRLSRHGDVAFVAEPLIQVREREPGHAAISNWRTLLRTAVAIHRRYIPQAYGGGQRLLRRLLLEYRFSRQMLLGTASDLKEGFREKSKGGQRLSAAK